VYDKSDVQSALIETSQGALGTFLDKFYGLFKKYNSVRGKYFSVFFN
jgi:hypothetical protein